MKRSLLAWVIFAIVIASPSIAILVLAIRGAGTETARAELSVREARKVAAQTLKREVEASILQAKDRVQALTEERVEEIGKLLDHARPRFMDVVVLDRSGALLVPAAPEVDAAPTELCAAARGDLVTAHREAGRRTILDSCADLRADSGRYLWPLLALESENDPGLESIGAWLGRHANRLGGSERALLRARIARGQPSPPRDAALAALEHLPSLYATLGGLLADPSGDDLVDGRLRVHRGRYVAIFEVLASGLRAGYVLHEDALVREASIEPRFVLLRSAALQGSDVEIAPRLSMHIDVRDPSALRREATRRADAVIVGTILCVVVSIALGAILLRRAQRAQTLADLRTDFVASVSHELRTPLASIRMLSELLEAGDVSPEERGEVEHTLAGEARRLSATLDRMLRFGALARGKLTAAPRLELVRPLVVECAARLKAAHPGKEVTIEVDEHLEAELDAGLVTLAVDNLLSNAAKYAPNGGPYRISAALAGDDLVLSVKDSGPGLDECTHAQVFLPFERLDSRLSRATEGTGVGLALVRGIARAHRGDAMVESRRGHGATFILRLPRKSPKGK